jgi:hypothetical protein
MKYHTLGDIKMKHRTIVFGTITLLLLFTLILNSCAAPVDEEETYAAPSDGMIRIANRKDSSIITGFSLYFGNELYPSYSYSSNIWEGGEDIGPKLNPGSYHVKVVYRVEGYDDEEGWYETYNELESDEFYVPVGEIRTVVLTDSGLVIY